MLKKNLAGFWVDRDGFVGAVMLGWNKPDADGKKHYRFLATPFDTIPVDIVENGEDDSVLISQELLSGLVARGAARAMTDVEAALAIKNYDDEIAEVNSANKENQNSTEEENKKKREERQTVVPPDPTQRTIVKIAEPQLPE